MRWMRLIIACYCLMLFYNFYSSSVCVCTIEISGNKEKSTFHQEIRSKHMFMCTQTCVRVYIRTADYSHEPQIRPVFTMIFFMFHSLIFQVTTWQNRICLFTCFQINNKWMPNIFIKQWKETLLGTSKEIERNYVEMI